MIRFETAFSFINDHQKPSGYNAGDIVQFEGYNFKGDLGAARWKALGTVGTPSVDPLTNNSPNLSDATGNEFVLVGNGVIDLNVLGGTGAAYVNIANTAGLTYSQGLTSDISNDIINIDTVSSLINRGSPQLGESLMVAERGSGVFNTITKGTTPNVDLPNGFNVIASAIDLTKAFKLRIDKLTTIASFGASPSALSSVNQGAIQSAIDNMSVIRGTSGIYKHNASFTGKSNVIIYGPKGFSLECDIGYPQENQITFPDGVENVKIHDVLFNMRNDINTPVLTDETKENSLNFSGCFDVNVYDCEFTKSLSRSIRFNGSALSECSKVTIENNRFNSGSKGGVQVRRYGRNVSILSNQFNDIVDSSFGGSTAEKSIGIDGTIGVLIDNNTITQTNGDAGTLIVEYVDRQSEDITISNNKCYGLGDNSIKIGASTAIDCFGNYSHNCNTAAFYLEGCKDFKVRNNFAYDSGTNSVILAEDGDTLRICEDGEITDNILTRANINNASLSAPVMNAWVTATAVTEGQMVVNAGNIYSADAAGTTGATAPVHVSGSVSDGGVTWRFAQAVGSENQNSFHIYTRGGGNDIKIKGNTLIEDSLTSFANGIRVTDKNTCISDNDLTKLRDGVIALKNSAATGVKIVKNNKGLATEEVGVATIVAPSTTETVTPSTILESSFNCVISLSTILNGTVAYVYKDAGANNQFVVRARNSSNGTPTVASNISVNYHWSATDASGTFAKTT